MQVEEIGVIAIYDSESQIVGFVALDKIARQPTFYLSNKAGMDQVKSLLTNICSGDYKIKEPK